MYTMIYYGRSSPGMPVYHLIKPHLGGKITDVGCGSGILLDKIKEDGFDVTGIDIASNCYKGRGRTVNKNLITIKDIRTDKLDKCDTVVCIDVMEHIPTKDVDKTIENLKIANKYIFQIALFPEKSGTIFIGEKLHLTIESKQWWIDKFVEHGFKVLKKQGIGKPNSLGWLFLVME